MVESTTPPATIIMLLVGRAENCWPGKPPSAIGKREIKRPLALGLEGFLNDEQADHSVHGGPEKAIHHYSADHMEFWRKTYPEKLAFFVPGCFGENVSTSGLDETNVCLGDVFSFGTAKLQVSQGRQPCWKLNDHTGLQGMAASFQETGKTGWYYRVLETGTVKAGDQMELMDRLHPDWPLDRLITARFNSQLDHDTASELAAIAVLSQSWRTAFSKKTNSAYQEDTERRLKGQ